MKQPCAADGRRRVAVVHLLPLEYYPPTTNLLRLLAGDPRLETAVFTVDNAAGRPEFACPGVQIRRFKPIGGPRTPVGRLARHLLQTWGTLSGLRRFRPSAILYFEPHSAAPVAGYLRRIGGDVDLCIHHHEYYAPAEFRRRGLRSVRRGYELEALYLLPRARWISQTHAERLRLFRGDHPGLQEQALYILPNHPPASWQGAWMRRRVRVSVDEPLRAVYVGSVSLDDTHLQRFCEWVVAMEGRVTFDIHGYKTPPGTAAWLGRLGCPWVRFFENGVDYDRLPDILAGYEVGVVLHRGCTPNYVFNTPNKLFEYQTCGLEVWVPREMKGCDPLVQTERAPRVRRVDFDHLDRVDLESVRPGLADTGPPPGYCCEETTAPLRSILAGDCPWS